MTIKMRLDTEGLRALIADNPELEVEIGKEVMNNIKLDQIENAISARIDACLASMCERSGWYGNYKYTVKDGPLREALNAAVRAYTLENLEGHIKQVADQAVAAAVVRAKADLQLTAKTAVLSAITPQMAREILLEALK